MLNRATQLLATDPALTSRNITVNSCCPGWCRCVNCFHLPTCVMWENLGCFQRTSLQPVDWLCAICYRTDMGGAGATKSPEEGAGSILLFVNAAQPVTGTFQRDGAPLKWWQIDPIPLPESVRFSYSVMSLFTQTDPTDIHKHDNFVCHPNLPTWISQCTSSQDV